MPEQLSLLNIKMRTAIFLLVASILQSAWLNYCKDFPLVTAVVDAYGSYLALFAILIFISYWLNYYLPRAMRWFVVICQSAALAFIWALICSWSFVYLFRDNDAYVQFWSQTFYVRAFVGWIIITNFTMIHFLATQVEKDSDTKTQMQRNEEMRKEAELFKLRQQLHPHFLFNSLNSINALIGNNTQQARSMVQQLSEFLRHTLKKEDNDAIPFEEELKDLRLYLSIEQVRFGNRLVVVEHINVQCLEQKIPPFLLQPLVENAIKFGLYGTIGKVVIHINAVSTDTNETAGASYIIFSISNPFDATAVSPKGTGFGLESIERRLYLLFARNDLLKVERYKQQDADNEEPADYFKATIRIPVATDTITENKD